MPQTVIMIKIITYKRRKLDNSFTVEVLPGLLFVGIILVIVSGILGGCA
jgi:hypothetical protein